MAKRIEKDGKFYRMRKGRLVEIPAEWVGKTTHPQTIRKRKTIAKNRKKGINKLGWTKDFRMRKELAVMSQI